MIINLISSPRNVSTAIMYSFHHRGDVDVVDEPFYAYYLCKTGVDHPGREEILASQPTEFDKVAQELSKPPNNGRHRFIKNMAHHLIDCDWLFMKPFVNVFLIRDPKQLIASFAQVISEPTMRDIGIKQQYEIFHQLEEWDSNRLVVNSGDLLCDPPRYMQMLCRELQIPYTGAMVQWPTGPIPGDGAWARYWYKNVHSSHGLLPQPTSNRPLPSKCESLYAESLPYYEELSNYALRI